MKFGQVDGKALGKLLVAAPFGQPQPQPMQFRPERYAVAVTQPFPRPPKTLR